MKTKDLIGFPEEWTNKSKLHFAIGAKNRHEPLYEFYKNEFQDWQNSQNNKNFERDYILSLIYYGRHEWLFAGVYKRIGLEIIEGKYNYSTELQDVGKELIGRLIIQYEKKIQGIISLSGKTYRQTAIAGSATRTLYSRTIPGL